MTPSTPHWLTRPRLMKGSWSFLVFFSIFGSYFLYYTLLADNAPQEKSARDFITFYAGAKLALLGEPLAVYDLAKLHLMEKSVWPNTVAFPWFYPPTYLLAVTPLALTGYIAAMGLFLAVNVAAFLIAVRRWIPDSAAIFPILAFPPVLVNIMFGQNGLITAALALLALYYLDSRPRLAGAFIGLLAIKPHLAVLFPLALLLGGHRQAFWSATLSTLAFVLLSAFCFGWDTWQAFFQALGHAREGLASGQIRISVMISPFSSVLLLTHNMALAYVVQALVFLGFTAVMVMIWRSTTDIHLRGSALVLATLNCSPYLFDYEMSWLTIPLALLTLQGLRQGWLRWEREILILAWLFPGIDLALVMLSLDNVIQPSLIIIPELLLLGLIVNRWRLRDRKAESSAYNS